MARKAPGKHYRKGMTIMEVMSLFPDDASAEKWFADNRWPDGVCCPACGSCNVQERASRKPQPYRCRDCRKDFSVRTGTLMQGSNLGFQKWALAIHLMNTNIKGVSSMRLHREIGITQKSAWHLAHRIRETWEDGESPDFAGPVEIDETYMGGKRRNMSNAKRKELKEAGAGRGAVGKTPVVGAKDRASNEVKAQVVESTNKETLQGFALGASGEAAMLYTDEAKAYSGLPNHKAVKHSENQYVDGDAHTNGIESFWSMLKRGHKGTYHKMSSKHLGRYVNEFAGRHNQREKDTIEQLRGVAKGMEKKRLRYADLVA